MKISYLTINDLRLYFCIKDESKELKLENENALKILESITGKPIKKLHETDKNEKSNNKLVIKCEL